MALIELLDPESSPEYRELHESSRYDGESPFRRAMLHNPAVLEARMEFTRQLFEAGPVDETLYEYIMVVVSQTNDCDYCAGSHRLKLMAGADVDEETIETIAERDYEALDRRERAIVEFTEQVVANPHRVTADHLEALYDVGFDETDVVQLLAVIANCTISNTIVSALNITPDDRSDDLPTY